MIRNKKLRFLNKIFKKQNIIRKINHATSPNRIVYASPPEGGSGYEKPQSGEALFAVFSPPQFVNPAKPTVSLIRVAKPSYTTRTLYAIAHKM